MTLDIYDYKIGAFDVIRLWFKKKKCGICNGKLRSFTEKKCVREGATRFAAVGEIRFGHGKEYEVEIKYKCEKCGEIYESRCLLQKE